MDQSGVDLQLSGARVAIAGSSRGLGFEIARTFVAEGAEVWLSGRDHLTLRQTSEKLNQAPYTSCDLATETGRSQFFEEVSKKWGFPDVLVLNVGSGRSNTLSLAASDEEWERVIHLNLLSHVGLIRYFMRTMRASNRAAIVSISSIAGQARLLAPTTYSTAKAALDHFCILAASEVAEMGIRYNVIAPGNIHTPEGGWAQRLATDPEGVSNYIRQSVPMRRLAKPEEIASFVVFVASPRASFCTGAILRVDGGQIGVV